MIFLATVLIHVKCMEKNLDTTKTCYSKNNYFANPLVLLFTEVPLYIMSTNNKPTLILNSLTSKDQKNGEETSIF